MDEAIVAQYNKPADYNDLLSASIDTPVTRRLITEDDDDDDDDLQRRKHSTTRRSTLREKVKIVSA